MEAFTNWLEKHGINMSNIKIEMGENNERRVVSINPIKTGDNVVNTKEAINNEFKNRENAIGRQILKLFHRESELTKAIVNISVYILFCSVDYGYTKFWDPYFEIFPKDLYHPYFGIRHI